MNRTMTIFAALATVASLPAPTLAQSADTQPTQPGTQVVAQNRTYLDVVAELESEKYTVDEIKRTFLGRMMITAHNNVHVRQIVVSSSTGEIMQDVVVKVFANAEDGTAVDDASTETTTGLSVNIDTDAGVIFDSQDAGGSAGGSVSGNLSIGN